MVETEENLGIDRSNLLLSVQRALLGAIGTEVLAICVDANPNSIELTVFAEGCLPKDQQEALDVAETEIWADFSPAVSVNVRIIENAQQPLKCSGNWAFVRFGCLTQ
jgi:hypothetical protein